MCYAVIANQTACKQHHPPATEPMANQNQNRPQRMLSDELEKSASDLLKGLKDELAELEDERHQLSRKINEHRRIIGALESSLGLNDVPPTEAQYHHAPAEPPTTQLDERTEAILNIAEIILEENSPSDMHYRELADEVRSRGGELPSNDKSRYDTFIRMMNQDPRQRFIRPHKRGHYALAKDHPNTESVGKRRFNRNT